MSFNLNTLALHDSATYQILHPVTDSPLFADEAELKPVTIELYGTSSKQYRNAIAALSARQLKRKGKPASFEQMREEGIDLLVACSKQINNLELDGKKIDNEDAFRELYANPQYSWLKSQVDAALTDTESFLSK